MSKPALERLPDWGARFAAEMDRQRREPFSWGQNDCALGLAAGAVLAITGVDLGSEWRGRYVSTAGARRALHKAGFSSLSGLLGSLLPAHEHPDHADVGDIGVIAADGPLKEALCVVDVSSLIVITELGHGRRPREDMLRAFKVG